ncbi:MAG: cob(I)yrinic acid a,c-diamide adenosyltransferase [Planctomycetia bacterium]
MVYLSRIYTKSGDDGTTGLGTGDRVPKDDARIEAYGSVDELNAVVGLLTLAAGVQEVDLLRSIGNDLFDLGADLCVPQHGEEPANAALRVTAGQVERLEQAIDRINERLSPLTSFILPGGTPAAAWCHLARTTCRRAERRLVTLAREQFVNPEAAKYLNRLSDLLFVLGRVCNDDGRADVLWKPGATRSTKD